ncbi:hypothetical protein B0H11DRAFT_2317823 [Mycena galericulata]|nr:hypothetical protein B0H11DRAFT_2317823 [Mycena galericulata]
MPLKDDNTLSVNIQLDDHTVHSYITTLKVTGGQGGAGAPGNNGGTGGSGGTGEGPRFIADKITVGNLFVTRAEKGSFERGLIIESKDGNAATMAELRSTIAKLVDDVTHNKLDKWLQPPQPGGNHGHARELRVLDTGVWLLKTTEFANWKVSENSFLWIHGIFYFYFDTNDTAKQELGHLIKSLVTQLSSLSYEPDSALYKLYVQEGNGKQPPRPQDLVKVLHILLGAFAESVYIVIDALDECRNRTELVGFIRELLDWNLPNLHVAVTSRREGFDPLKQFSTEIPITPADVEGDIQKYVTEKVGLQGWEREVKELVMKTLVEQGKGMFRLIACQLEVLDQWDSLAELKQALAKLPGTLTTMYDSILEKLPQNRRNRVHKIMQWLVFAARPLTLAEVIDALAFNDSFHFSPGDQRVGWKRILDMCGSLVTATTEYDGLTEASVITLAHASVKEYLTAGESATAKKCGVNQQSTHYLITRTCLGYLCYFDESHPLNENNVNQFPLARYAAQFWPFHACQSRQESALAQHICELLRPDSKQYITWIRLHNVDEPWTDWRRTLDEVPQPLYLLALLGLVDVLSAFLEPQDNDNAEGGGYGTALQAASAEGHDVIVIALLNKGANVNVEVGYYSTALQVASANGHITVVRALLDKGANINIEGGHYGTALQAASAQGHNAIVLMLLDKGANVNAEGGEYGTALQAASSNGHDAIVRALLNKGANINAEGGYYGSALQAALAGGHNAVVMALLDKGANANTHVEQ